MRPEPPRREPASLGADLDAYRRHRGEASSPVSALAPRLEALRGSDQPQVVFARVADLAVALLCDACEVEIDDGSGSRSRTPAEQGRLRQGEADHDAATELHVAVSGPGRSQHPAYVGIVTFSWSTRSPTEAEQLAAELVVRHAEALVDHERLLDLLGAAEGRAAEAALRAITTRSINLAVGIAMHQHGSDEEASEDLLRQSAAETGLSLYGAAARAVRRRALPDPRRPGLHLTVPDEPDEPDGP